MSRAVTCLLAILTFGPAQAVKLEYKFEPGEKMVYHDRAALSFETEGGEGFARQRMQLRSDSRIQQVVKKRDGDVFTIEIETIANETTRLLPGEKPETSSNTGHPERVRLRRGGQVIERTKLDKDADSASGLTTPLDEFAILQQALDAQTLPADEVEPGHRWTDTVQVDLTPSSDKVRTMTEVTVSSEFRRLVMVKGEECAELVAHFRVPLRAPANDESRQLKMRIEGFVAGRLTTYFSLARGRALVELGTFGAIGEVTMQPEGARRMNFKGRLMMHIKTVLED